MAQVRIALAQVNPCVGDLDGNRQKIVAFIRKAKIHQPDLVVFPELVLSGYPPEDLLLNPQFIKDNLKSLKEIIPHTEGIVVILGFVDSQNYKLYNAAALIVNKRLYGIYHKISLPNYGVFDEKRYFQVGEQHLIFDLKEIKFGITICEDIWMRYGPTKIIAEGGAEVIINLSASPYHRGKLKLREKMLKERALQTQASICYINLVGGQDELVFDGASRIFDREAKLVAGGNQFQEELIFADLKIEKKKRDSLAKDKIKYIVLPELINKKKRPLPRKKPAVLSPLEEIYKALVLGTHDYVYKNGFRKAVLGLSGGIDSALTACIAVGALGKENVVAVIMPSPYSSKATLRDARCVAENLGIKSLVIPIDEIFQAYLSSLRDVFLGLRPNVAEENIQARIRGNILMALSNKFGWLVLTTGNKSEVSVGYCTLYGDMAGGFAVIKDVPKTLVYKLARWYNKKEGRSIIPRSIFGRAPSAELRPGQKDEDSLPAYKILDPILEEYVEKDTTWQDMVSRGFAKKIVKEVIRMVDKNEYKRRQAPPGIKITPRAFGKDRRFPITNRYNWR